MILTVVASSTYIHYIAVSYLLLEKRRTVVSQELGKMRGSASHPHSAP